MSWLLAHAERDPIKDLDSGVQESDDMPRLTVYRRPHGEPLAPCSRREVSINDLDFRVQVRISDVLAPCSRREGPHQGSGFWSPGERRHAQVDGLPPAPWRAFGSLLTQRGFHQ